jgi:hypothetical protein
MGRKYCFVFAAYVINKLEIYLSQKCRIEPLVRFCLTSNSIITLLIILGMLYVQRIYKVYILWKFKLIIAGKMSQNIYIPDARYKIVVFCNWFDVI